MNQLTANNLWKLYTIMTKNGFTCEMETVNGELTDVRICLNDNDVVSFSSSNNEIFCLDGKIHVGYYFDGSELKTVATDEIRVFVNSDNITISFDYDDNDGFNHIHNVVCRERTMLWDMKHDN